MCHLCSISSSSERCLLCCLLSLSINTTVPYRESVIPIIALCTGEQQFPVTPLSLTLLKGYKMWRKTIHLCRNEESGQHAGRSQSKPEFWEDVYPLLSMFLLTCYWKMWQNSGSTFKNNTNANITNPSSSIVVRKVYVSVHFPSLMPPLSETFIYAPAVPPI